MSEKITEYQVIRAAVLMIYNRSDFLTKSILDICELKVGLFSDYWDLRIIAPDEDVWEEISDIIESLLERMAEVMGRFSLSFCLADNPIPNEVVSQITWTEKDYFEYDGIKYVELRGKQNQDWVVIISRELLEERWLKVPREDLPILSSSSDLDNFID